MSGPNVVQFKREGWRDAVSALSGIVEKLKSGELPPIVIGCLILYDEQGALATYGMGPQAEDLQLLAMLELGKTQIIDQIMDAS
jgi:hypothetical protein